MNEIDEIKIPKGVESISVTQHDDKIVIEFMPKKPQFKDIPQPKFKVGDSVMIKEGVSSKTHRYATCSFVEDMDKYIGKKLIVADIFNAGCYAVRYFMVNNAYNYDEDWLEPYSDEPIVGELAIFWDSYKEHSQIRLYAHRTIERHRDHEGMLWANAIKFISKEQFEKHIKE